MQAQAHSTDPQHHGLELSGQLLEAGPTRVCFGDSLQLWTRSAYAKSFSTDKAPPGRELAPLG